MSTVDHVKDKVVVVTGAGGGFGGRVSRKAAARGARLVCADRDAATVQATVDAITAQGGDAIAVPTDVTSIADMQALAAAAVARHGRIDVMINNAGLMPLAPLEMLRFDEWDQCIDVNIKGVLWGIAAALPYFKQRKSGQFINVSSVAGHTIGAGGAIYSATKYSVRVISEALRKEVKPYNIRTTVLSPGAVDTELPASVGAPGVNQAIADYYKHNAIGADSFARCVLFAMSQPEDIDINEILFRPTRQEL